MPLPPRGQPVYLDYGATTPVDARVIERMVDCLGTEGDFGNPASTSHAYGWDAAELVEEARVHVAALINADPREIVWTSGATESDNLALKGVLEASCGGHLITSAYEHKAVLDTAAHLVERGVELTLLEPSEDGLISPHKVADAIRDNTVLVSIMHVNNEVGTVNDIATMADTCRERGVVFHTDAAQSTGKIDIDVQRDGIDLLSISGHKIYGPKGIGALFVRREPPVRIAPQIHGGGHERGMRSGTLATHQIVGLGEACRICAETRDEENARILNLRNCLWSHLGQIPGSHLNGSLEARLPGNLNVGFEGIDGETLLMALDDVAVSSGSACTSATVEPSHVLRAMGVPDALARSSLRFTVGRYTTQADVDYAGNRVASVVASLQR